MKPQICNVPFNSLITKILQYSFAIQFLLLCFLLSNKSIAQEDFFQDIVVTPASNNQGSRKLEIFGWVEEKLVWGLEAPDSVFSRHAVEMDKLETSSFLQFDWQAADRLDMRFSAKLSSDQIYHLQGKNNYSAAEINEFQSRFEVKDFYLDAQLNNRLYVKLGHQIIAWGMAENLRIGDQLNTLNLYTLGHQDLEDLRLQIPAARLTYSLGSWTFDGVLTYDAGFDDLSPAYDEFDTLIRLREDNINLPRIEPEDQYEYVLRANASFNGGDISLLAADINNNSLYIDRLGYTGADLSDIELRQDRFQVYAVAGNRVFGSWLVATELGIHLNKKLAVSRENWSAGVIPWLEKDQALGAINVQYNGLRNWVITLETNAVITKNYQQQLTQKHEQFTYSLRVTRSFLNERIQVLGIWNQFSGNDSEYARFNIEYDWSDNIELGLLWVYHDADSESTLYDFRHNDILQFNLRYSFQL